MLNLCGRHSKNHHTNTSVFNWFLHISTASLGFRFFLWDTSEQPEILPLRGMGFIMFHLSSGQPQMGRVVAVDAHPMLATVAMAIQKSPPINGSFQLLTGVPPVIHWTGIFHDINQTSELGVHDELETPDFIDDRPWCAIHLVTGLVLWVHL